MGTINRSWWWSINRSPFCLILSYGWLEALIMFDIFLLPFEIGTMELMQNPSPFGCKKEARRSQMSLCLWLDVSFMLIFWTASFLQAGGFCLGLLLLCLNWGLAQSQRWLGCRLSSLYDRWWTWSRQPALGLELWEWLRFQHEAETKISQLREWGFVYDQCPDLGDDQVRFKVGTLCD